MTEGTVNAASEDNELFSAMEELERVQQRVAQLRQQSREKALGEVREKIKMYALTPEELGFAKVPTGSHASRKKPRSQSSSALPPALGATSSIEAAVADGRSQVKPKYRSPNGQHTWSGRGKPPLWMQPLLGAGAKKENFLVDKSGTDNAE